MFYSGIQQFRIVGAVHDRLLRHDKAILVDGEVEFHSILVGPPSLVLSDANHVGFVQRVNLFWEMDSTKSGPGLPRHLFDDLDLTL